MKHLEPVQ